MKPISKTAMQIKPSATLRIDALYKQMKADGLDIVGFGAGEPDFDTPDNIKNAACEAIKDGKNKYTPAAGIMPLRQAIADKLKKDISAEYDPAQIIVASGAKHSIYIAMQVLLNPGDEVIIPAPYWITYIQAVNMASAIPVTLTTTQEADFKITPQQLEKAITEKTKVLIICNPSNPTGMLYTSDELQKITDICIKYDLYILADEIYSQLIYDNKNFTSVAALGKTVKEHTILISGVSKTYAMTGWRVGYSASENILATAMDNYLSHSTGAPCTISQYAALEALRGTQDSVGKMRAVFQERRDYMVSRVNAIKGLSCIKPDGAFYVMMNIEQLKGRTLGGRLIENSDDFALSLLEKGKVATISCTDFGCSNYIRLTYAASMETIKEGMDRIERFVQ